MRRTWISDTKGFEADEGDPGEDPLDIEDETVGDVIECVGWWKAGASINPSASHGMIVEDHTSAKGAGGDDIFYVTQWKDSSGNGNHLLDDGLGEGPQIYGSGTGWEGSASDEVGNSSTTYPVAHFTNLTSGVNQGQKFLECTPAVADDFRVSDGDEPLMTWVICCRHHYDSNELKGGCVLFGNTCVMGTVVTGLSDFQHAISTIRPSNF